MPGGWGGFARGWTKSDEDDPDVFTYPDKLLHELFYEQAAKTPDSVAVVDGDRSLTYAELADQARTLATFLRKEGVKEEAVVPIFMPRCLEFAVSYIAALSAGGAYAPLEVGYPADMLRRVIKECKPARVITLSSHEGRLPDDAPRICLDAGWQKRCVVTAAEARAPPVTTHMDSLAYVVYSSGTTGAPKGITCPHRGSMLRPLLRGATLVVIPDTVIYDPKQLADLLEKEKVTRMLFTPSLLEAVLDSPALDGAALRRALACFRAVVLCGEVVTAELRSRVLAVAPPGMKLLNLYSISETHDVSMLDLAIAPEPDGKYCSTGPLLPGVEVLIMTDANNVEKHGKAQDRAEGKKELSPVPLGMEGEIFAAGRRRYEYLLRPDLNAKRFPPRPANLPVAPQTPGQDVGNPKLYDRLYDTGDWGRLRPDGTLEILGRHDSMQKIRGYSVELRAVETALLQCANVTSCVVKAVGAEGTDKHIAPSPSSTPDAAGPPRLAEAERKTLGLESAQNAFALHGETEAFVAELWAEVLELPMAMVDPEESFFDMGGHSLRATKLVARLNAREGVDVKVAALFERPTIRGLAAFIAGGGKATKAAPLPFAAVQKELDAFDAKAPEGFDIALRVLARRVARDEARRQPAEPRGRGRRRRRRREAALEGEAVLLTGATGFLGAHLLASLANEKGAEGDLSLERLGLVTDHYLYLATVVDRVVHCAAKVNLVFPYDGLRKDNVTSTMRVLHLAMDHKVKPVTYVSTDAVFPMAGGPHAEDGADLLETLGLLENGYAQSKAVAELLQVVAALTAAQKAAKPKTTLREKILRAGWNTSDSNLLYVAGMAWLGMAPSVDGWRCELTPVDFAAKSVLCAAGDRASNGKAFNLVNAATLPMGAVVDALRSCGVAVEAVSYEAFRKALDAARPGRRRARVAPRRGRVPAARRALREYAYHLLEAGVLPPAQATNGQTLRGEVAFVTGASGGIGAAIARALGAAGCDVCLAARREDRAAALAKEIASLHGCRALAVACDVTSRRAVKDAVAACARALGPPSILINNAGVMHYTLMRNGHEDEWEQAVDVNCKGVLNGIGAAFAGLAVYSGTKFFVEAVSQGLRAETAGTGVKVTTVQPGDTKSNLKSCTTDEEARALYAQPSEDRNLWLDPNDVARTVVWALSQPPHVAVNGSRRARDAPA
ncbi:L-cystine transmembrane transporter [Aureococcus anophagefferens]|nr:L-cystine transmembrane transporter [Aureococcus anophagefferens]